MLREKKEGHDKDTGVAHTFLENEGSAKGWRRKRER